MHWIQVLKHLKKVHSDIKAIMITAVEDEDIAREAMNVGASDSVTKPLDRNYIDVQVTFLLAVWPSPFCRKRHVFRHTDSYGRSLPSPHVSCIVRNEGRAGRTAFAHTGSTSNDRNRDTGRSSA